MASSYAGPNGWYFLQYPLSGGVALAYLKGHQWQWGGAPPPDKSPNIPYFLGSGNAVAAGRTRLGRLLTQYANPTQAATITAAIDAGLGKFAYASPQGGGKGFTPSGDIASTGVSTWAPIKAIDSTVADIINSTTDFLKLISWLFLPRNWLRAVEFLFGTFLFGFGAWSMLQARSESSGRFYGYGGLLRRSPVGRAFGGGGHRQTDVERVRTGSGPRQQRRRERDRRRPRRGQQRTKQS